MGIEGEEETRQEEEEEHRCLTNFMFCMSIYIAGLNETCFITILEFIRYIIYYLLLESCINSSIKHFKLPFNIGLLNHLIIGNVDPRDYLRVIPFD